MTYTARIRALMAALDAMVYGTGMSYGGEHLPLQEAFGMTKELPLYTCHKQVRALEIRSIGQPYPDAEGTMLREVRFADPAFASIDVSVVSFARFVPMPGDYYVVYEDGYASFSPRKAFLDGYALANDGNVLMDRLNDLAQSKPGEAVPVWLHVDDWCLEIARVAREAYVTINSLKHQVEQWKRAAEEPDTSDIPEVGEDFFKNATLTKPGDLAGFKERKK